MENQESEVFNISPSKVSRRLLNFLAEISIIFILSVFLFEVVAAPSTRAAIGYYSLNEKANDFYSKRSEVLSDNKLLYFNPDEDERFFEKDVSYTADLFIENYLLNIENTEYNVFYSYFIDIRKEEVSTLNEKMIKYGEKYFDISKTSSKGLYLFNDNVSTLIRPKYEPGNAISKDGQNLYNEIKNVMFLQLYSDVLADIKEKDLTSPYGILKPFNYYTNEVIKIENKVKNSFQIAAASCFLLCSIVFFFIIPLCNFKGKTLSEMVLKLEQVDINNFHYLKKRFIITKGLINTLNSLPIIFLIPMISYGFSKVFSLNILVSFSFIGVLFVLLELIILLSSKYTRNIKEFSTNSIVVDKELMEEYYSKKGLNFNGK